MPIITNASNKLQHTATHCNTLQHRHTYLLITTHTSKTLLHTAAHCKHTVTQSHSHHHERQQDAATHCNKLQHTATHTYLPITTKAMNTLQHAATRCNALQHAATRCNTEQKYTCPSPPTPARRPPLRQFFPEITPQNKKHGK